MDSKKTNENYCLQLLDFFNSIETGDNSGFTSFTWEYCITWEW